MARAWDQRPLILQMLAELADLHELRGDAALSEVRTLKGLIPICAQCKRVRDDKGYWEGVESYISERSELLFSHSICAQCGPELYGADWEAAAREEATGAGGEG